MTSRSKHPRGQPEVLAGLAAAAKSSGKKPAKDGLYAASETVQANADPAQQVDAASRILREGATKTRHGAAEAIRKLPDRARGGK